MTFPTSEAGRRPRQSLGDSRSSLTLRPVGSLARPRRAVVREASDGRLPEPSAPVASGANHELPGQDLHLLDIDTFHGARERLRSSVPGPRCGPDVRDAGQSLHCSARCPPNRTRHRVEAPLPSAASISVALEPGVDQAALRSIVTRHSHRHRTT